MIGAGTLLVLAAAYLIFYFFFQDKLSPPDRIQQSIAVLPFVNMSNDPEQEFFSDGMTDEILNHLYKIGDLKVISRTSSMKFKGAKLTAKEIAGELSVANILEGSVQKAGGRIKITVQLIDAISDNHLWSETYERDFKDIFSIQSDIATSVARELNVKLGPRSKNDLGNIPTQNQLAYEFYLKGRDYRSKSDPDNAIRFYSKAIHEDTLFASAYAGRAIAHLIRHAQKASGWETHLSLADLDINFLQKNHHELPELKLALAYRHNFLRRNDEALAILKELQREIPNELHDILCNILRSQGKWQEAQAEGEHFASLDPLNARAIISLCFTYKLLHEYEKYLATAKHGLSNIPEYTGFNRAILTATIALDHDFKKAWSESGLTPEEAGYRNEYMTKDFDSYLSRLNVEKNRIRSESFYYAPITFEYALVHFIKGDAAAKKLYADSAIQFLLTKLPQMKDDYRVYTSLGRCYALLGEESKAIEYGNKAVKMMPIGLNAWQGSITEEAMADIYLFLGKYDLALDKIERLLSIPSELSVGWLLVDPKYEGILDHPRFKKLVEKYK